VGWAGERAPDSQRVLTPPEFSRLLFQLRGTRRNPPLTGIHNFGTEPQSVPLSASTYGTVLNANVLLFSASVPYGGRSSP
jgi:hypothetical protein